MVDFNLTEGGAPTINDDVDCLKQQISILFSTKPGDLMGALEYGCEYETYLYDLQLDSYQLSEQMMEDLYQLDLLGWYPEVDTRLLQGTERDIALINVELKKGNQKISQIYRVD